MNWLTQDAKDVNAQILLHSIAGGQFNIIVSRDLNADKRQRQVVKLTATYSRQHPTTALAVARRQRHYVCRKHRGLPALHTLHVQTTFFSTNMSSRAML